MKITDLINEVTTKGYHSAAQKDKLSNIVKTMFKDPADPNVIDAKRKIANRDRGIGRISDRNEKAMAATAAQNRQKRLEQDRANLPELIKQLEKLRAEFDPNFEYSDDHSVWSEQKGIQQQIHALQARINAAGGEKESASGGSTSSGAVPAGRGKGRPDSIVV